MRQNYDWIYIAGAAVCSVDVVAISYFALFLWGLNEKWTTEYIS